MIGAFALFESFKKFEYTPHWVKDFFAILPRAVGGMSAFVGVVERDPCAPQGPTAQNADKRRNFAYCPMLKPPPPIGLTAKQHHLRADSATDTRGRHYGTTPTRGMYPRQPRKQSQHIPPKETSNKQQTSKQQTTTSNTQLHSPNPIPTQTFPTRPHCHHVKQNYVSVKPGV
jgi:hypothetical protein